jgi:CheY-like chemotaxis protein
MFMNLCIAARDSMPNGGELLLTAGLEEVNEEILPLDEITSNEPWVVVTLKDTGEGIKEDACKQVFTPLFTTTLDGGCSGLGLTVIYGVVRAHNGYVTLETEPGQGTTVKLYFPQFDDGAVALEPLVEPQAALDSTKTILLIDDDPTVLRSTRRLLEQRGFEVICASNGQVALEIFRARGEHIDLVMLDLVMPIMDGIEAFGLIKEARDDVPVIIASGCRERDVKGQAVFERWGRPIFLAKPFSQNSLYQALERVFS